MFRRQEDKARRAEAVEAEEAIFQESEKVQSVFKFLEAAEKKNDNNTLQNGDSPGKQILTILYRSDDF